VSRALAIGLIVVGVVGIIFTVARTGSARSYVEDHYKRVGDRGGVRIYESRDTPAKVAKDIQKAHKAADRRVTPEGIFLRYRKDFIGILSAARGSRIEVANENRGYAHFYPFSGGFWGSYSGPAESFRGGGPGGGGK
jgi:hypothetical protein